MQSPEAIAELMYMWNEGRNSPAHGSFIEFEKQKDGSLGFKVV